MVMRRAPAAAIAALLACAAARAQPLDRLSGGVTAESGEPLKDADVGIEAIFGFAGGDFLGQRTFTVRTGAIGAWALLAFKSGVWVFDASAPGRLPDAIALPFNLVAAAGSSTSGLVPAWHPVPRPSTPPKGDPMSFGAALAIGSTALVQRDVDAAARAFSDAR